MATIAVGIIFFQKLKQTIECIESFAKEPVIVYLLNNGSDPDDFNSLKKHFTNYTNIHYFESEVNLGPARGRNYILDRITEDWVVFADNDITVSPANWPKLLVNEIENNPSIEVFLPTLFNVHENEVARFLPFEIHENKITDSSSDLADGAVQNWFPSGACMVKQSFFKEVGQFDNELFAFEDYEMGLRCILNKREIKLKAIGSITFVHDHQYQSKGRDKAAVLERYNNNRLLNSVKHIESKFNIEFAHDWSYWTNKQVKLMTNSRWKIKAKNTLSRAKNFTLTLLRLK